MVSGYGLLTTAGTDFLTGSLLWVDRDQGQAQIANLGQDAVQAGLVGHDAGDTLRYQGVDQQLAFALQTIPLPLPYPPVER